MNAVDIIILLLVLAAVRRGANAGFVRLFSYAGGISGVLIGAWLAPRLVGGITEQLYRFLTIIFIELLFASLLSAAFKLSALNLEPFVHKWRIKHVTKVFGVVFEVGLTLAVVWLIASLFSNVRTQDIGREIRQSAIIAALNNAFPPAPDVFARIEKAINLNGFPDVFVGQEPQRGTVIVNGTVDRAKIDVSIKSVVQVYGIGCGGIVEGSGWVVDTGYVVTNAHVIAGVSRLKIQDRSGTHTAVPVYMDKDLDIAVLRVPDLGQLPLALNETILSSGSPVVAAGYPGGGPLTLSGGAVITETRAVGRDIYNRGIVARNIYEFQADVEPGNSGGPLLDADGKVIGVVFAKAVTQDNVGYAVLISEISDDIERATTSTTPVSSGRCASE